MDELLNIIQQEHKLAPETIEILKIAADLKKDVEKSDVFFLRTEGKANISADISKKLNYLNNKILNSKDPILEKALKHETLTMCASGKDRTGLAEHDQTAGAIAIKLNMKIQDVDKQLLKSGHTAGQAGGIYAGGATIGCYGTLQVTSQGFPKNRRDVLQPIMEVTAANNKIKLLKNNDQIIDEKKEQAIAKETPNMVKDKNYNMTMLPVNIRSLTTTEKMTTSVTNSNKELVKPVVAELATTEKITTSVTNSNKELVKPVVVELKNKIESKNKEPSLSSPTNSTDSKHKSISNIR